MLDIEIVEKKELKTYYIIDTSIRNAICMFAYNQEEALSRILELKESYEKLGDDSLKNLHIIEIDETIVAYRIGDSKQVNYSISNQHYYFYTYEKNAYEGKSGFIITEFNSDLAVAEYIEQNKLTRILAFLDRKVLKCLIKGLTYKKTFSLFNRFKTVFILISKEYYDWVMKEGSDI